jgi:hypothetical protein
MVDDADERRLSRYRWHLFPNGLAYRRQRYRGERRVFYMHREVVGATHGDNLQVEHANGDKLDNRRANLRILSVLSAPSPARAPDDEEWRPEGVGSGGTRSPTHHTRARSEATS